MEISELTDLIKNVFSFTLFQGYKVTLSKYAELVPNHIFWDANLYQTLEGSTAQKHQIFRAAVLLLIITKDL